MKMIYWGTLFAGIVILTLINCPPSSIAEVDINIGINVGPPPPVVIPVPPAVIVIPGTYVYVAPDVEVDILFYHGYWYRPHEGRWYRATVYNGPWIFVEPARVPGVLLHLPSDYHHLPPGHARIPYGQLKKNWKTWEKERHWDNKDKHEANMKQGGKKGKGKHKD